MAGTVGVIGVSVAVRPVDQSVSWSANLSVELWMVCRSVVRYRSVSLNSWSNSSQSFSYIRKTQF